MGNEKKITIADVAKDLGVSKTTVSRAISGKGRIGETTRKLVLDYIEEHDYRPNIVAQGLAQSKTFNIGVTMPGSYELMDLPFFQQCLAGIHEMASGMGYDILLTFCDNADISYLERIVNYQKVDGMILMRNYMQDKAISYLKGKSLPFVVIGSTAEENVCQVDHNHREACRELTSILMMKQMQKIALIGGDENMVVTQERLHGFGMAYEDQKQKCDDGLIFLNCDNAVMIEKAVEQILSAKTDCIACMDDFICQNVLTILAKKQIRVPEDIRVASFYNSTVLENNVPSITSLSFGVKELGMQAAKMLCDRIDGESTENRRLLGYEVVLKESTK